MKIEVDAHEIVEANISKISLVKRGANRAPFRIIKAEGERNDELPAQGVQPKADTSWLVRKDHSLDGMLRSAARNQNGGSW